MLRSWMHIVCLLSASVWVQAVCLCFRFFLFFEHTVFVDQSRHMGMGNTQ